MILRVGKATSLVAEARKRLSGLEQASLRLALGTKRAADIQEARELIERCGARAAVEERLENLIAEARRIARAALIAERGRDRLLDLTDALGTRSG